MEKLEYTEIQEIMKCRSLSEVKFRLDIMHPEGILLDDLLDNLLIQMSSNPEFSYILLDMLKSGFFGDSIYRYSFGSDYYLAKLLHGNPDFFSYVKFDTLIPFQDCLPRIYGNTRRYSVEQAKTLEKTMFCIIVFIIDEIKKKYGSGIVSIMSIEHKIECVKRNEWKEV